MSTSWRFTTPDQGRAIRRLRGLTSCPPGHERHFLVGVSPRQDAADWHVGLCCSVATGLLDRSRLHSPDALAGIHPDAPRRMFPPLTLGQAAAHACELEPGRRLTLTCPYCQWPGPAVTIGCGHCVQLAAGSYTAHIIGAHIPPAVRAGVLATLGALAATAGT